MFEAWINFLILVFVELLFFIVIACYCQKKISEILRILVLGILTGFVVGLLSDLLWGRLLGLWSYTLGYDAVPLILNAMFVWGFFSASVLIMQKMKLLQFFVWIMAIMIVYETANYLLGVWTYGFTLPFFWLLMFLAVGNLAVAIFVALVWHVFLGRRFLFIEDLLKKF